ncbi:DUF4865 family protein [Pullulanibacillus sp. KACC 23026]|uniref:DUF4865 family protein n=1 Tax=Pullulanibacillus sp. KACC 23026 TaxID=3028315 RepID=UPI0023AF4AA3|nr:DUF4865 family protein [Pullulanibacillus sp. KACC 23026]WEG14493.1 DUF4865 family protein [Pullulanibacillus sp. KACC 23026]
MIGMQYKITLPSDYNMDIIRNRVKENGFKTDGFRGLNFKMYIITEKGKNGNLHNSYAPLYLWNDSNGMNRFIFEGSFNNILESFGWQKINIGIPLTVEMKKELLLRSDFLLEISGSINETNTLSNLMFDPMGVDEQTALGKVLIYDPDKWGYSQFYLFESRPMLNDKLQGATIYEILHISKGN